MGSFLLAIDWSLVRVGLIILATGIFTVVIETVVMVLFKFDRFGRSLVYSIMANIGSLLLGILLFLIFIQLRMVALKTQILSFSREAAPIHFTELLSLDTMDYYI